MDLFGGVPGDAPLSVGTLNEPGPVLGEQRPGSGAALGGIVVPTGRDFRRTRAGLEFAAGLASAHGCALVVIHSREARAGDFPEDLRRSLGSKLVLIDLDQVHPSWRPPLASAGHPLSRLHRSNDVAVKRNLGVMLAHRLGWEYLLFLDDDISALATGPTLNPDYLSHALRTMTADERLQAVGWPLVGFDDNSVVGHARPLAGLSQDVFIGGGALLVRCSRQTAFFPENIYNEDWLFLIQTLASAPDYQHAVANAGAVHQAPYEAFDPLRARSEEVGEIIGEGLMNLVEDHGPGFAPLMSGRYWKRVMAGRRALLRRIIRNVDGETVLWAGDEPARSDHPVVVCMNTALWSHEDVTSRSLAGYTRLWWHDQHIWRDCLAVLSHETAGRAAPERLVPQWLRQARAPWPAGGVSGWEEWQHSRR
ncbi:hypothetical protein KIH74_02760 [Kineosporia sp. J2-2]|uniref:Uncharacterized protein n=1 Tax=Kineosporia corallincola TaxID=2835133 RepID=A0ABS5T9T3_9ACTN|nr:hypothetical protein [Kineosporia corallincola]MBT0767826.1 hypothetical protein [Kineosporia corallincola]